jgi:hypothetical protein
LITVGFENISIVDPAGQKPKKNAPMFSGRWVAVGLSFLPKFRFLNLPCAATSRHVYAGGIIVAVIGAFQMIDRFHVSRKHTTAQEKRQARANKFPINDGNKPQRRCPLA